MRVCIRVLLMRRLLAGVLLAVALPLTGCVQITDQTESQQQQIGDVRLSTTFCLSVPNADGGTCQASNTNSDRPVGNDHARLLLGYRVPTAAVAPPTVSVSSTEPAGTLTLSPSPTYTSELQRLSPAPAGQKWVGYISRNLLNTEQVGNSVHTATADFALGRGSNGSPFIGPFDYKVTIGARGANPALAPAPATVVCHPTDARTWHDPEATICSDSPKAPAGFEGGTLATKDVGVLNGATVTAEQGTATSIPFQVRSVGSGLPIMNLSAGTTAPAATATSSLPQIQPIAGTQNVPVSVDVASNTPPGTYDVTLTATTVGGQQLRVGKWQIVVTAPPSQGGGSPAPPAQQPQQPQQPSQPDPSGTGKPPEEDKDSPQITFASAGKVPKLKSALKTGLKFAVSCNEGCAAFVTLKAGKTTVGTGAADKLDPGGKFTVTAKFTKKAKKKYAKAKKLKLSAVLAVQDGAGLGSTSTRVLTLKR